MAQLREHFSSVEAIATLRDVEQSEWDLLVTRSECDLAATHLWMIALQRELKSPFSCGSPSTPTAASFRYSVGYFRWSRARTFAIPDQLDPLIMKKVEELLIPIVTGRDYHPILTLQQHGGNFARNIGDPENLTRFLETSDGLAISGSFVRYENHARAWCIPGYIDDPVPWVVAACTHWNRYAPDIFPLTRDWRVASEWATDAEGKTRVLMSELDERQVQVNREIDTARARLLNSLAAESAAADDGVRRLLTEQGGALVEAVTDALQNLGFVVRDMDPVWGSAPKREDLRVSDPDYPDWTAIVEVRGYSGGAALNDLVRLHGRFRTMYNKEAGYLPTRTWYIVNQFRETDPSDRPVILASHEGELQAYGEDGVLALDTRTLFRLLMAVERGDIPARDCREQLRDATGRYEPF